VARPSTKEKKDLPGQIDAPQRELLRLHADVRAVAADRRFACRVSQGTDALDGDGPQKLLWLVVRDVVVYRQCMVIRTSCRAVTPTAGGQDPDGHLRSHASQQVLEGQQQIPNLIQEVDDVPIGTLPGPADPDVLRYPYHMTAPRPGLPRSVAHFLGEVMVNAIREHAGDQAAVDAIRDWRRFVPLYQAAAHRRTSEV